MKDLFHVKWSPMSSSSCRRTRFHRQRRPPDAESTSSQDECRDPQLRSLGFSICCLVSVYSHLRVREAMRQLIRLFHVYYEPIAAHAW